MARIKIIRHIFRFNGFRQSFKIALRGMSYLFLYHRNMRIIFMLGIAAMALGVQFRLKGIELAVLCIAITLVFIAEIFNTTIELLIDMFTDKFHIKIKLVKDIAAGVVVVTCLNAVAVGCILFLKRFLSPN